VHTPIDGSLIARAQAASEEDVEAAAAAAGTARASFGALPAAERVALCERAAELMDSHAEEFVAAIVADLGKTVEQAESEVTATRQRLRLVRGEARRIYGEYLPGDWVGDTVGKMAVVRREPVGTTAAIGPFNYPLFLSASKIIPALVAGNTVVAKAPSDAPVPLVMFARVLQEAGFPPGACNLLTGSGSRIGGALAGHPEISMLSFTGSSNAGHRLHRDAGVKLLHLELGGNAAAVVLGDADVELAAAKSVDGAFKSAGQRCDAISRALVEEPVYAQFVDAVAAQVGSWSVGDPRAPGTQVGPMVSADAAKHVSDLVRDAMDKGARLDAGGEVSEAYHQPTVLADVPVEAEILWEEHFGPVLPITRVSDLDAALELANRSRYGLDSAVFSSHVDRAWRAATALQCGMVTINDAPKHGVGHFPFGGHKPDSGIGREGLGYSIDECTQIKTVVQPT
jgi:acyl-CoA reductase-like NAD-dependent aldehyde dehydrogenase